MMVMELATLAILVLTPMVMATEIRALRSRPAHRPSMPIIVLTFLTSVRLTPMPMVLVTHAIFARPAIIPWMQITMLSPMVVIFAPTTPPMTAPAYYSIKTAMAYLTTGITVPRFLILPKLTMTMMASEMLAILVPMSTVMV